MKNLGSVLPLVVLALLFYVLVLRPSQKRQRVAAMTAHQLEPGVEVMTTAGMLATVHAVTDEHVDLEIAPGVVVRYVKAAVAKVVPPETDSESEPAAHEAEDHDTEDHDAGSSAGNDAPTNTSEA